MALLAPAETSVAPPWWHRSPHETVHIGSISGPHNHPCSSLTPCQRSAAERAHASYHTTCCASPARRVRVATFDLYRALPCCEVPVYIPCAPLATPVESIPRRFRLQFCMRGVGIPNTADAGNSCRNLHISHAPTCRNRTYTYDFRISCRPALMIRYRYYRTVVPRYRYMYVTGGGRGWVLARWSRVRDRPWDVGERWGTNTHTTHTHRAAGRRVR